jgi:hypothetical protein
MNRRTGVRDAVGGMEVGNPPAAGRAEHNRQTYYFGLLRWFE